MSAEQNILDHASPSSSDGRADATRPSLVHAEETRRDTSATSPESDLVKTEEDPPSMSSSSDSLEASFSAVSLASTNMFRALASIFQASHMHEGNLDLDRLPDGRDFWATLRHGDELESQGVRDLPSLRTVKVVLERMLANSSRLLLPALRLLADGSRDASWRVPLGESGILDFALQTISSGNVSSDVQIQSLRLIGNACADTDENRERVVSKQSISVILAKIQDSLLASVAVPVLYNVCREYGEPAQEEAVTAGLYPTLIKTVETGALEGTQALGYLCRLLDLGSKQLDPSKSLDNSVELLLRCATQPGLDVDDSVSLVDCAVAHLELETFQRHMIEEELFGVPLRYLIRSYFPKATLTGAKLPAPSDSSTPVSRDPDEEAELSRARKALIQALSDVSALPEFSEKHGTLKTPLVDSLTSWISSSLPQIQLCSCIVLGNLAREDQICIAMVSQLSLHHDLVAIARNSPDSTVLHAALSFLRNLALPADNKLPLGECGLIEALTRFWTSDFMPLVAHAAAAIVRQLVNGCTRNVERLMTPLSDDVESPAHAQTYISLLLSLFDRTDEQGVKIEIARAVAAIVRSLNSDTSSGTLPKEEILQRLYSTHPSIGMPLGTMVTQSRYPVVRSEGWFALALMARQSLGAINVSSVVTEVSVFTALEEAIRGRAPERDSSSATPMTDPNTPASATQSVQADQMRAKDRDNAMILVNELLQHRVGLQFSDLHLPLERFLNPFS